MIFCELLDVVQRLVPYFDGENVSGGFWKFHKFISMCDLVHDEFAKKKEERRVFVKLIRERFIGLAYKWICDRTFETWRHMRLELFGQYGDSRSFDRMVCDLKLLKQNLNESVRHFGERVYEKVQMCTEVLKERYQGDSCVGIIVELVSAGKRAFISGLINPNIALYLCVKQSENFEYLILLGGAYEGRKECVDEFEEYCMRVQMQQNQMNGEKINEDSVGMINENSKLVRKDKLNLHVKIKKNKKNNKKDIRRNVINIGVTGQSMEKSIGCYRASVINFKSINNKLLNRLSNFMRSVYINFTFLLVRFISTCLIFNLANIECKNRDNVPITNKCRCDCNIDRGVKETGFKVTYSKQFQYGPTVRKKDVVRDKG